MSLDEQTQAAIAHLRRVGAGPDVVRELMANATDEERLEAVDAIVMGWGGGWLHSDRLASATYVGFARASGHWERCRFELEVRRPLPRVDAPLLTVDDLDRLDRWRRGEFSHYYNGTHWSPITREAAQDD